MIDYSQIEVQAIREVLDELINILFRVWNMKRVWEKCMRHESNWLIDNKECISICYNLNYFKCNRYVVSFDCFRINFRKEIPSFSGYYNEQRILWVHCWRRYTCWLPIYIESYYNQLKSHYSDHTRNIRMDRMIIVFYKLCHWLSTKCYTVQ